MMWFLVLLKIFEDHVVFWYSGRAIHIAQLLYVQMKTTEESCCITATEKKSKMNMFEIESKQNFVEKNVQKHQCFPLQPTG